MRFLLPSRTPTAFKGSWTKVMVVAIADAAATLGTSSEGPAIPAASGVSLR